MIKYNPTDEFSIWSSGFETISYFIPGGHIEPYCLGFNNSGHIMYPEIAYYPDLANLVLLAIIEKVEI